MSPIALTVEFGPMPVRQARTMIGLAGSVTTPAAMATSLPVYDAARRRRARVCPGRRA